jgi:hypothetical protein
MVVSNLEGSNINKTKYNNFFPKFDLKAPLKKEFYIVLKIITLLLYLILKQNVGNVVMVLTIVIYLKILERFGNISVFIIDRVFDSLIFDGTIILIGSSDMTLSSEQLKNEFVSTRCYYYPLWEDEEFKIFMEYFKLSNKFDRKQIGCLKSQMGLEKLSKTDVYGILYAIGSEGVKDYLPLLNTTYDFLNKNHKDIIHQIFFIKPTKSLISNSLY